MADPAAASRDYLLDDHRGDLQRVLNCADAVAASWDGDAAHDRDQVVEPLRAALDRDGVVRRFPDMLRGAVEVAGRELRGQPVAAPPYVAVTSRGPVLRATTDDGRLVATVEVFGVEREPTRYVRVGEEVEEVLTVAWTQ